MFRLVPLSLLALVFLPAAASARTSDGCPPSSCGAQSVTFAGSRLLYVRTSGAIGPLVAYDLGTGRRRFSLGRGFLSANGSRFFSAPAVATRTPIKRYDTSTGRLVGAATIRGRWWLAGVSANGRWLALAASRPGRGMTRLAVASDRGAVVRTMPLHGWWEVETVSNDGKRLFLIQHLSTSYVVRLYDVAKGALRPGSLKIKGEGTQMTGSAWGSVGSPDGHWLLTLYLKNDARNAFVHALDLRSAYARCIDLPGTAAADFASLGQYVFVLAPDGKTLFAANPALGVVAQLDIAQGQVVQTAHFTPSEAYGSVGTAAVGAISHDGRTLYFSTGGPIWAYDSAYGRVRGPYSAGRIAGLGFSRDDRRLYVVRAAGSVATLDAARGTTLKG